MNRYQITADIDVTLWLGTLLHYKHVPSKIEYINLDIVTPDGVARIFADVDIEFDGTNPHLQKSELGTEIEKRLQERHSEGLAGIADELIHVNTFIDIH